MSKLQSESNNKNNRSNNKRIVEQNKNNENKISIQNNYQKIRKNYVCLHKYPTLRSSNASTGDSYLKKTATKKVSDSPKDNREKMKPGPDHNLFFYFSSSTVESCINPVTKLSYDITTEQKSNVSRATDDPT